MRGICHIAPNANWCVTRCIQVSRQSKQTFEGFPKCQQIKVNMENSGKLRENVRYTKLISQEKKNSGN